MSNEARHVVRDHSYQAPPAKGFDNCIYVINFVNGRNVYCNLREEFHVAPQPSETAESEQTS